MLDKDKFRYSRVSTIETGSQQSSPLLAAETADSDLEAGLEEGTNLSDDDECGASLLRHSQPHSPASRHALDKALLVHSQSRNSRWTRRKRLLSPSRWICCCRRCKNNISEKSNCGTCKTRRGPLRIVLRSLAIALMLLGLIEFVILVAGLVASFFPTELETAHSIWRSPRPNDDTSHWPTDYTADIEPVQCHSHNDYWRPVPLKSAIRAGCTGVEADLWKIGVVPSDDLYVGHSRIALTPQRTFRSLYVDPLVEILGKQNPNTTFHPGIDNPRRGVFDTAPRQTLVLLIDFKTDGEELWPIVQQQLEPLRERQYLSHFNGTHVVQGPITVVVTGNAPFNRVVENSSYRDMFFDAPLDLLGQLAPKTSKPTPAGLEWKQYDDVDERTYLASYIASLPTKAMATAEGSKKPSNQGQGHSGSAPKNAAIYTPANSYYASVAFTKAIGFPLPFLSRDQKHRIRQQIAGAHKQGLKVRYWNTPAWPRGLREYVWSVLVEEGADYLNVDDLQAATQGHWGGPRKHDRWSLGGWSLW